MIEVSENFTYDELICHCGKCKEYHVLRIELIDKLESARGFYGKPMNINSWCRCTEHNKKVGGVDSSAHVGGWAVDIAVESGRDKFWLFNSLFRAGFSRIGIAKTFIHADCDPSKVKEVIWTY